MVNLGFSGTDGLSGTILFEEAYEVYYFVIHKFKGEVVSCVLT